MQRYYIFGGEEVQKQAHILWHCTIHQKDLWDIIPTITQKVPTDMVKALKSLLRTKNISAQFYLQ